MLTYNNQEILMSEPEEKIYSYMDGFFDFHSLVSYINLTYKGAQKYPNNRRGILDAILNCTTTSKDYQKYNRFELKCKEWDLYFDELFIGFDRTDINKAIAFIVARDLEQMKLQGKI